MFLSRRISGVCNLCNLCNGGVKFVRDNDKARFYHAYDNYMMHAFPHDELKPLTKAFTDSLAELGNFKLERLPEHYNGSALSLIESLSSLVIMGNNTEFEKGVSWLSENLTFDLDVRINLFENHEDHEKFKDEAAMITKKIK